MANQPLTPEQCGDLAQEFHDCGIAIGDFRLKNATTLSTSEQFQLQNAQMLCFQYSSSFIVAGLSMEQSTLAATLYDIKAATAKANLAMETIAKVDKALNIASALAVLAGSIYSMNPSSIYGSVQGVLDAVK